MEYSIQPKIFLHQEKSFSLLPFPYYEWGSGDTLLVNDAPYKKLMYIGASCALVISSIAYINAKSSHLVSSGVYGSLTPQSLTNEINTERILRGLPAYLNDPLLSKVAQAKADDMAKRQYYSDADPQGKSIYQSLHESVTGYLNIGESLGLGYDTPAAVLAGWTDSAAGKQNVFSAVDTNVGVGIARGTLKNGTVATYTVLEVGRAEHEFYLQ